MEESKLNKIEINKSKFGYTEIKINNTPINFVGKYSICQDINFKDGIPILKIEMAIDEKNSHITI